LEPFANPVNPPNMQYPAYKPSALFVTKYEGFDNKPGGEYG
jgi:hypothetical protein